MNLKQLYGFSYVCLIEFLGQIHPHPPLTAFRLHHARIILQLFTCSLSVPDHLPVFATAKILSNYIPFSHYTPLASPALSDNRGIHHTISRRRFYKLSKMLHRGNSNYRLLHYTLKYTLCLGERACV